MTIDVSFNSPVVATRSTWLSCAKASCSSSWYLRPLLGALKARQSGSDDSATSLASDAGLCTSIHYSGEHFCAALLD